MKNRLNAAIICGMFMGVLLVESARAGQVVTDNDRSWARNILSQEKALEAEPVPGTLAVLYFVNQTGNSELDPLGKGLALMLITDLMSVNGLQVVERVRLQALVEELGLGVSGLVAPGTAPRVGRLLGVSNVISGSILAGIADKFKIIPIYLKLPDGELLDLAAAEGEVAELFRMEKELLFAIIENVLQAPLTDQERSRLMTPMTKSIKALFFLFKAIMYGDLGNFSKAAEFSQNALREDPDLFLASEFLEELKRLGSGSGKIDPRAFLKSLRNRTSHTDQLSPDLALRRARTPAEIGRRQELRPPKPDDVDDDGDGFTENQGDCDDTDAAIHSGATEICGDGIDQDCNGSDLSCDDVDNDGDGFTESQGDCNDGNSSIHPGALEVCGDGIDQDCGGSDLICPEDVDGDGDGYSENQGDCNDSDASVFPGASEACGDGIDQDCNDSDLSCDNVDQDGDGYSVNQGDCNDEDAVIHPGATEVCGNEIDENCDGSTPLCPNDIDNDKDGFTENQGDCNDFNAAVHPGAVEICGNLGDENCDGIAALCPEDIDNDGDGFTENQGDCNDGDPGIHPSATEICGDGIDQDCNGQDETCPPVDNDQDGYTSDVDCNDNSPDFNPGISCEMEFDETGNDYNCDGLVGCF